MKQLKALEILKKQAVMFDEIDGINLDEAIAELEASENRSCDGCEYDNDSISDSLDYCANCVRSYKDNYKAKE